MADRLNVTFSETQTQTLKEMATYLEATPPHVIRTALALLALVIQERKKGNQVGIVKGGQVLKEIVGLFG